MSRIEEELEELERLLNIEEFGELSADMTKRKDYLDRRADKRREEQKVRQQRRAERLLGLKVVDVVKI